MAQSLRRTLFAVAVFSAMPLLVACPKKDPPPPPPPPPPPAEEASTALVPMEEDAGGDADAEAGPKKYVGPGINPNVLKLKQCCAALKGQAKNLGASPEAGMLMGIAMQCDALAAQAGPSGNAPELGALRAAMAGKNVPAVCAGL